MVSSSSMSPASDGEGDADALSPAVVISIAGFTITSICGIIGVSISIRCCGLLLKNKSRILSKSDISAEVGVGGPFFPRVSRVDSSEVFSVSLMISIIEMTLVNSRCSESDRHVFGFKKRYRWAADLFSAAPRTGPFWVTFAVLEP